MYNLPPVMMEVWEAFKHEDRLLAGMIETPGITFDVYDFYARDERKNLEIYKNTRLFLMWKMLSPRPFRTRKPACWR